MEEDEGNLLQHRKKPNPNFMMKRRSSTGCQSKFMDDTIASSPGTICTASKFHICTRKRKTLLQKKAQALVAIATRTLHQKGAGGIGKYFQVDGYKTAKTLFSSKKLGCRLDLQGLFMAKWSFRHRNIRFANLQVQLNVKKGIRSSKSTTLAQLCLQVDRPFPVRFVRRGFVESINQRCAIWLWSTSLHS
jgi:hypothetical protein